MSGCQSEWCLSSQFSDTQASNIYCSTSSEGKNLSKQLLQQLTERQLSNGQNESQLTRVLGHLAAPLTEFEGSLEGINICPLLSRTTVWLFVIQWSSTEVNGTKQVSACLLCLCRAESLIYHSGDVYRLQFQDYEHFFRARRHLLNFGFHVFHKQPYVRMLWISICCLTDIECSVNHKHSM